MQIGLLVPIADNLVDPIWLFTQETSEVPIEDESKQSEAEPPTESKSDDEEVSPEEVVVEEVEEEKEDSTPPVPKTMTVTTDKWVQLNAQPPIWMR